MSLREAEKQRRQNEEQQRRLREAEEQRRQREAEEAEQRRRQREAEQQRRQDERDRAVDDLRMLTIRQAAEIASISIATLRRLIKKGDGPKITRISDRRIGITVGDLRRWLASRPA